DFGLGVHQRSAQAVNMVTFHPFSLFRLMGLGSDCPAQRAPLSGSSAPKQSAAACPCDASSKANGATKEILRKILVPQIRQTHVVVAHLALAAEARDRAVHSADHLHDLARCQGA